MEMWSAFFFAQKLKLNLNSGARGGADYGGGWAGAPPGEGWSRL
jgi:hypothetical protein